MPLEMRKLEPTTYRLPMLLRHRHGLKPSTTTFKLCLNKLEVRYYTVLPRAYIVKLLSITYVYGYSFCPVAWNIGMPVGGAAGFAGLNNLANNVAMAQGNDCQDPSKSLAWFHRTLATTLTLEALNEHLQGFFNDLDQNGVVHM